MNLKSTLFKPLESSRRMIEDVKVDRELCLFSRIYRHRFRRLNNLENFVKVSFKNLTRSRKKLKLVHSFNKE